MAYQLNTGVIALTLCLVCSTLIALSALKTKNPTHPCSITLPREAANPPLIQYNGYIPASSEDYIVKNAVALGYVTEGKKENAASACTIWQNASATTPTIYASLVQFRADLKEYNKIVHELNRSETKDLRTLIAEEGYDICKTVDLHPDGVMGIFARSGQLSYTSSGFVEPLLPPMRHPDFCEQGRAALGNLTYMVHDFGAMCRKLKPTSRIVFIDMGAYLHRSGVEQSPALTLLDLYRKFGIVFDHIYAYDIKEPPDQRIIFQHIPRELLPAYHWVNVGVDAIPGSLFNPLTMLLDNFHEDDLVVVKLDIDTPSIELPLAMQILEDEKLVKLVDQFYFEHHVSIKEMANTWGKGSGNMKDSMDLFQSLRKKGVASHFWV